MARVKCPVCGNDVVMGRGQPDGVCSNCGNSVSSRSAHSRSPGQVPPGSGCQLRLAMVAGLGVLVAVAGAVLFFIMAREGPGDQVKSLVVPGVTPSDTGPDLFQFGGTGTGRGLFDQPSCIATDAGGRIYVGESESGRVQVFDDEGVFITQWTFARAGDQYLSSMASSPDGILYMVYESELHIHSGETGEHLGNLSHPDGWGFSDVDVSPDGIITAFWYKNRDDVITFDPRGGILVLLREAVSGVTGDSELSAMVACGNRGETFTLGSFNSVVVVHDSEGSFIDRFGSDDIFTMPAAMDVDPRGRLWISDFGDLKVFDAHGNLVRDFDPGVSVSDMVIDQQGRLWGITSGDTIVMLDTGNY